MKTSSSATFVRALPVVLLYVVVGNPPSTRKPTTYAASFNYTMYVLHLFTCCAMWTICTYVQHALHIHTHGLIYASRFHSNSITSPGLTSSFPPLSCRPLMVKCTLCTRKLLLWSTFSTSSTLCTWRQRETRSSGDALESIAARRGRIER